MRILILIIFVRHYFAFCEIQRQLRGLRGCGGSRQMPTEDSSTDFDAWAEQIWRLSDSNRNAALSIVELQAMCSGTEHEGFVEWLTSNRAAWFKHQ